MFSIFKLHRLLNCGNPRRAILKFIRIWLEEERASQVVLLVKNLLTNAGHRDMSIPGLGRSPGGEMSSHSSILAGRISWAEEPNGLQFM